MTVGASWFDSPARVWRAAFHPDLRRLRWVLAVSLIVQLTLAPLTSWGTDTPGFVQGVVGLIYRGNPYASAVYFDPPLGPYLQAPFFELLGHFQPVQNWLTLDPAMLPAETGTGMISAILPSPGALMSLKLPLILASLAVGALIFRLGRRWGWSVPAATASSAAWLLNPLVIWATAVHGEVDVLADLCVAIALFGFLERWPAFIIGVALGLGFFAKIYPILLVPPLAVALATRGHAEPRWTGLWEVGGLVMGVGVSILAFLGVLQTVLVTFIAHPAPPHPIAYGGVSVLLVFNHFNFNVGPLGVEAFNPLAAEAAQWTFLALAGIAELGAILLMLPERPGSTGPSRTTSWRLIMGVTWISVATILLIPDPQPENLLAVLLPLLFAAPYLGTAGRWIWSTLTLTGLGIYFTFVTPLGFFLPAAHLLGDGTAPGIVSVTVGYFQDRGLRLGLWDGLGLLGGAAVLALWCLLLSATLPARWMEEVKRRFALRSTPVLAP
jgi:hypothetical protein